MGNGVPPALVLKVAIVLDTAEHIAEPDVLAAAVAVAVCAVDRRPVIGADAGVELAVHAVMQQILACVGGKELDQIENTVGICAGGGDKVVGVDPRAGGVGLAVAAVGGQSLTDGQIVDGSVRMDGEPCALEEIAELAGIAEAEVHSAQRTVAEIGIRVVKVALDADVGVKTAVLIKLSQLLDDGLALLGDGAHGPVFAVRAGLAGEDGAGAGASGNGDAGALRQSQRRVDLVPIGELVVARPPADITGGACGLAVGQELIDRCGDLALVDLVKDGLVVNGNAAEGGICKGGHGVDGVGGGLVAGVELVVRLPFLAVHHLVERGIAVGIGVDDLAEVGDEAVLHPAGDLVALAPGREQIGGAAGEELGLHTVVEAVRAGVIFQRHADGLLDGGLDGVVGIAVEIVEVVAELGKADVDRFARVGGFSRGGILGGGVSCLRRLRGVGGVRLRGLLGAAGEAGHDHDQRQKQAEQGGVLFHCDPP